MIPVFRDRPLYVIRKCPNDSDHPIYMYLYQTLGEKHTLGAPWYFSSKFPLINYLRKCYHEGNLFDYGLCSEDFIQSKTNKSVLLHWSETVAHVIFFFHFPNKGIRSERHRSQ